LNREPVVQKKTTILAGLLRVSSFSPFFRIITCVTSVTNRMTALFRAVTEWVTHYLRFVVPSPLLVLIALTAR